MASDRPDGTPNLLQHSSPMLWSALGVFIIALIVRVLAGVVVPVQVDEPWHLLAGHSWLQDGTFRTGDGAYTRTTLFTIVVAWFMGLFGETVAVGRFPSSIAGAALTAAVFVWTYRQSGRLAAWSAAGLLCFLQLSVQTSAFVRFYAPHALFLWIGSVVFYQLTSTLPVKRRSMIGLGIAISCLIGAFYLQKTTAVALVPLSLWLACDLLYRSGLWDRLNRKQIVLGATLALALGAVAIGLLTSIPVFYDLIATYRDVRAWYAGSRDDVLFYHHSFMEAIPLLWALSPVAAIIAWLHRSRAASFCAVMWFASVILMSFGGLKADRYMFFAVPYLCALWGLAVASTANMIEGHLEVVRSQNERAPATGIGSRGIVAALCIAFFLAVASQASFLGTAHFIKKSLYTVAESPRQLLVGPGFEPWATKQALIAAMAKRASIVLTNRASVTLMYLGHFDVELGRNAVDETAEREDFSIDPRSGRPAIGTAPSLRQVITCFPSGLALIDSPAWRTPGGVDEETADVLTASAKLTEIKVGSRSLLAFEWTGGAETASAECDRIRAMADTSPRVAS